MSWINRRRHARGHHLDAAELLVSPSAQRSRICGLQIRSAARVVTAGALSGGQTRAGVLFPQVRCGAVPAHWAPDRQEAASIPHARGRSYDVDRTCGWGPEVCSNGGCWLFDPVVAVEVWICSEAWVNLFIPALQELREQGEKKRSRNDDDDTEEAIGVRNKVAGGKKKKRKAF